MRLKAIVLDRFSKVNDKVASHLLKDDELVTMQDCVLDYEAGKPIKRGHWSRYSTNTAGAGILRMADLLSGSTNRMAVSAGTKIETYDPSTDTFSDWIISLTNGNKFRYAPFGDKTIFTFDTDDQPRLGDNDFSTYWDLEIPSITGSQVASIQSFHDNGGDLEQNTLYKWIMVGLTADGQLGVPSRPFTHFYDSGRDLTTDNDTLSTRVYFKNLPHIADSRVVTRMLFRTKAEGNLPEGSTNKTGEVYYFLTNLDNDSTGTSFQSDFEDDVADANLGVDIVTYLNMPTRAKYLAFNRERLFLADFTQTDRMFISPPSSQTGGSAPTGYTDGYELATTDTAGGTGTLNDSTQYDYRIHYVDKIGRNSYYYHEIGTTTSAGSGSNDHQLQIDGIGVMDLTTADEYGRLKIYRRTAGAGSYYLIFDVELKSGTFTGVTSGGLYSPSIGRFVDFGLSNLTETWTDPSTETKDYPTAICFSDISLPSTVRDENKRQVFMDDGDKITGIFNDVDGVIVFKKNSISKIYTTGNYNNWQLYKLIENIGCTEPDSIVQRGQTYYFVFNNRVYKYNSGEKQPTNIGYLFQDSLDRITTWYDATADDERYMIAGYESLITTYWVLVWDIKLETWYKFSTNECKALTIKKFTQDIGEILSVNSTRITQYNEPTSATRVDTETGSDVQISPAIQSKTYLFPDGITKARMRKLKFNYKKVTGQNTTITVYDEDSAQADTFTDNTGSGNKLYKATIGVGNVNKPKRIYLQVAGAGLEEWNSLRVEYRPIREGSAV